MTAAHTDGQHRATAAIGSPPGPIAAEAAIRQLVAEAGRILDVLGLVDNLGHCSARVPGTERVVVKPSHSPRIRSMRTLGPDDMIVVDLDGRRVEGDDEPPLEVYIHTEIYRARADINAVVHTHQRATTLMGVIEAPILPILHVPAAKVDDTIALWPCPVLVNTPERGRELAAALGDATLCHLQGHGVVAASDTVQCAVVLTIMLEQLAEANLRVLQTGRQPRLITLDELADLRGSMPPVDGMWEYYRQLGDVSGGAR